MQAETLLDFFGVSLHILTKKRHFSVVEWKTVGA